MRRRYTLEAWLRLLEARRAAAGASIPRIKRTLPRSPDKTRLLVDLAARRIRRGFPELFETIRGRRFRLRPGRGARAGKG